MAWSRRAGNGRERSVRRRTTHRPATGATGATGATVAAVALAAALLAPAPAARAAVPTPGADAAVVEVYVGDVRTGPTSIGPAPAGAVFGLFASNPSASIGDNDGFVGPATAATALFTCASDADGDCAFVVPIRPGAVSTSGVPQGTRLWVAPVSAPTGYYANPYWQTAPLSNTNQVSLRHVFQTPALVGGQSYREGEDWITDPGLQTSPANTTSEYTRRVASDGAWPLSRVNPDLPQACGLNVAVVVDLSSSVAQANAIGPLKSAIGAFVEALRGTPSQAALFTFGTDSPATGYDPNTDLMPVATAAEVNDFESLYAGWTNPPTNYTNWDRAFAAVAAENDPTAGAADHFDLAVFITDGNPTVYGPDPLDSRGRLKDPSSGYTRFRELGNGLASANLVKSQGTRVLAVGVGTGVAGTGSAYNLRTVSGRDAYDGTNILDADYFQTTDYAAAGQALHNLVLASCAPSVSVIKRIVPNGATTTDDAYAPGDRWSFSATSDMPSDVTVTPASGRTDLATGGIAFDLGFEAGVSPTVTVAEDLTDPPGYTARPDLTQCVNKSTEATVTPTQTVTPGSSYTLAVPVGVQDALSCVVYNEAPPGVTPASVVVDKRWRVTGEAGVADYPEGAQPAGLTSRLGLSGPTSTDLTEQGWSVERDGYDVASPAPPATAANGVAIGESVAVTGLPGCTVTGVTLEAGAPGASTPGSGTALYTAATSPPQVPPADPRSSARPLAPGLDEWTVTNLVTCVSRLTLVKQVASGDGDPAWWTLHALGPSGALPGPSGSTGTAAVTRVEVSPDAAYQLAEATTATAPHDAVQYAQEDVRTRPLEYPGSTGSWACDPDPSVGAEGAVTVPLGQEETCVAVNQTGLLTVAKTVSGGTAAPTDFVFALDPIAPVVPGGEGHDVVPGQEQTVVPGQHYRLTEKTAVVDYTLTSLTCTSGGSPVDPADLVALAGASVECAATNAYTPPGSWTVAKTSDPPSGSVVFPGQTIAYTVTAEQLDGGAIPGVVVTDDLSGVLDHAALVAGSVTTSAGTATVGGTTLTWRIPALSGTQTVRYRVRVTDGAWDATLRNVLVDPTADGGRDPVPCADPPGDPVPACWTTTHRTPDRVLPVTGSGGGWALPAGLALVVLGGAAAGLAARLRREPAHRA